MNTLTGLVRDYVNEYWYEDYQPTENERALIEDAIFGLLDASIPETREILNLALNRRAEVAGPPNELIDEVADEIAQDCFGDAGNPDQLEIRDRLRSFAERLPANIEPSADTK